MISVGEEKTEIVVELYCGEIIIPFEFHIFLILKSS